MFGSEPEVDSLLNRVSDYRELLGCVYQNDYKISQGYSKFFVSILRILWSLAKLIITGILALPGIVLSLPALIVVSVYSRHYQRSALQRSTVKIRAVDVAATGKIVSSSLCFVISILVEPLVILLICYEYGAQITFLDYLGLANIMPWLFYLTIFLGGRKWRSGER